MELCLLLDSSHWIWILKGHLPLFLCRCVETFSWDAQSWTCVLSGAEIPFCFWQEALQRSRPGFIARSQGRVRELERRTQERREVVIVTDAAVMEKRTHRGRSISLKSYAFVMTCNKKR